MWDFLGLDAGITKPSECMGTFKCKGLRLMGESIQAAVNRDSAHLLNRHTFSTLRISGVFSTVLVLKSEFADGRFSIKDGAEGSLVWGCAVRLSIMRNYYRCFCTLRSGLFFLMYLYLFRCLATSNPLRSKERDHREERFVM